MKSLFAKILLWFVAAALLTAAAVAIVTQLGDSPGIWQRMLGALLDAQLQEAITQYETGGPEALGRYLKRFETAFNGPVYVTDNDGRDLVTGRDHRELIDATRRFGDRMVFAFRQGAFTRTSRNGRYHIFVPIERRALVRAALRPRLGLVLLAVMGLCALLAGHLTRPVRALQRAVEQFGRGETRTRIRSTRKDELGQLARSFDQMADRISESVEGQRRLLLDVSHELRSPLARLTIATDLLRSDPADEAALRQIEIESVRLNELVGEILQAHRPASDEDRRRFRPVSLTALLGEIAASCRVEAEAQQRRLELRRDNAPAGIRPEAAGEPDIVVSGDRELLRRAIENVIRNAIRYTPAETAVEVSFALNAGRAAITVRDRGPGVPESALPHLFEAFYRAESDRSRASGGVGLGLTIARRAVEIHRGTISARNANPGLEVLIEFPAA